MKLFALRVRDSQLSGAKLAIYVGAFKNIIGLNGELSGRKNSQGGGGANGPKCVNLNIYGYIEKSYAEVRFSL